MVLAREGVVLLLVVMTTCLAVKPPANWQDNLKGVKEEEVGEKNVIFEGDMIMRRDDVKQAVNDGKIIKKKTSTDDVATGAATAPLAWRWKDGVVPYEIEKNLAHQDRVKAAMDEWSAKTCIKFRQKKDSDRNYVTFKSSKWGRCASYIGCTGGQQFIYLGFGCRKKGIIIHEIGHALGFYHEQSRPDRDQYITINWENISEKLRHNFKKYNRGRTSDMGTKYDYDSIMHYGKKAFLKNKVFFWKTTINVKGSHKIGQRERVSELDAKEMNLYYECPK